MELCIDFGGTEIKIAVVRDGEVRATDRIPAHGRPTDLAAAGQAAHLLCTRGGFEPTAVGIAVPGVVDPASGRMLHANAKYDYLREFDLARWAADDLGHPAIVENDARAALIGETSTGSAAGERDAVLVTLGTGIGTAALIAGVPLRGATGHGGILGGHVTVDVDGPECPCGNVGCAELLASAWALRERGAEIERRVVSGGERASSPDDRGPRPRDDGEPRPLHDRNHQPRDVRDLFESDEHAALRDHFLQVWGATVVNLVHAYDPRVVILSGGILRAGERVSRPIETYVREHLWRSLQPPRFVVPPEPELSVVRGLSTLASQITTAEEDQ